MSSYWDQYSYTAPIAAALTAEFGTTFDLYNTGGGCICLYAALGNGDTYLLVGSGIDGPLWGDEERAGVPHGGGYGVGVYREETGETLAYVTDSRAETPAEVIVLVNQALGLVPSCTDTEYVGWERNAAGEVSVRMWKK